MGESSFPLLYCLISKLLTFLFNIHPIPNLQRMEPNVLPLRQHKMKDNNNTVVYAKSLKWSGPIKLQTQCQWKFSHIDKSSIIIWNIYFYCHHTHMSHLPLCQEQKSSKKLRGFLFSGIVQGCKWMHNMPWNLPLLCRHYAECIYSSNFARAILHVTKVGTQYSIDPKSIKQNQTACQEKCNIAMSYVGSSSFCCVQDISIQIQSEYIFGDGYYLCFFMWVMDEFSCIFLVDLAISYS